MAMRVLETGIVLLLVFGRLTCGESVTISSSSIICPVTSVTDSIFQFQDLYTDSKCPLDGGVDFLEDFFGVAEGDEVSLQRAMNLVHNRSHEYVSVLFYASWCPFSQTCRSNFTLLSNLYPSILHFAVEESSIRPSILSRYGVHGFPTLFLLNTTTRVRYHGSRTLISLVRFYRDITGIGPVWQEKTSFESIMNPLNLVKLEDLDRENCPFCWARFPGNLLQHETYLALATTFVFLRLLHFLLPTLLACVQYAWSSHIQNASLVCFWKHPLTYLDQVMQAFSALKEPCKRSNLQEGALNARAWASTSLTSVSIGDSRSSQGYSGSGSQ